jgi:hypothetical protein
MSLVLRNSTIYIDLENSWQEMSGLSATCLLACRPWQIGLDACRKDHQQILLTDKEDL